MNIILHNVIQISEYILIFPLQFSTTFLAESLPTSLFRSSKSSNHSLERKPRLSQHQPHIYIKKTVIRCISGEEENEKKEKEITEQ